MKRNFKQFLAENRWFKGIPNTLTVCNSLCGFAAILNALQVYRVPPDEVGKTLAVSALMILGAMVFDALDGFTARIFNAASMKGLQMDSLADMVTFGVAPAVLVVVIAHMNKGMNHTQYGYHFAWMLCAVYLATAAHRLARYNEHAILNKKSGDKFTGLPSPGAAAAVCSMVLLFAHYDGFRTPYDGFRGCVWYFPLYTGLLGVLMVSNVRYQHMGKWLESIRRNRVRMAIAVVVLLCFVWEPYPVMFAVVNLYVLYGLVKEFVVRFSESSSKLTSQKA